MPSKAQSLFLSKGWLFNKHKKATPIFATVAELVDAYDSKSYGVIHESSILSRGTKIDSVIIIITLAICLQIYLTCFKFLTFATNS